MVGPAVVPVPVDVVGVVLDVEVVVADVVPVDVVPVDVVPVDVVVGGVVAVCDALLVALPDAFVRGRRRGWAAAWALLGAGAVVRAEEAADVT